ncbi:MAG: LytTR family transcriptional regulator [Alistipes sp.]|nr:LytTR family transcriptional regulator [Alistipes sp.]
MRYFAIIGYWCIAVVVIAAILASFDYDFSHALFLASLYLPALLCLRIAIPKVDFSNKKEGIRNVIFILSSVVILIMLLMLLANISQGEYPDCQVHSVMINPLFILLILTAITTPQIFLEQWLAKRERLHPQSIDFISDRHRVSLNIEEITYVESNDSEVWIHTLNNKYRTKTTISQWESILDNGDFIRIHRAYLVNLRHITAHDTTSVRINECELPISRKYRETAKSKLNNCAMG